MKNNEDQIQQRIANLERKIQQSGGEVTEFMEMDPALKLKYLEQVVKMEEQYLSDESTFDILAELHKRLELPDQAKLDDRQLTEKLHAIIDILAQFHVGLDFTDHLSDRELYTLLLNDILQEGVEIYGDGIHATCHIDVSWDDPDAFERYYAIGNIPLKAHREKWLKAIVESYRGKPIPERLSQHPEPSD